VAEQTEQTLAAFLIEDPVGARRFLSEVQRIDSADPSVRIVDAAIADRTDRGRVKVHQTQDTGALKGGARGTAIGVVVGTILLGPAGPVVGGVLGGTLGGLHNRFRDIGIDDKFMRTVTEGIEKGQSALFVLYEGDWGASIGAIQDLVKAERAQLIHSTLPAEKAAALQALISPVVEELGGEAAVADYEVVVEEAVAEEPVQAEPEATAPDDLTRIKGIGPKTATVLTAAGVDSYARLAATSEPEVRNVLTDAHATVPKSASTWAMQAAFAAKGDWPGLDAYLRASQTVDDKDVAPAAEEPAPAAQADDLTQLSGIGPKAAEALVAAGITSYEALSQANEPQLRHALHGADMMPPSGVGTWPMQASYAARGDWRGLMKYNQKRTRTPAARSATAAPQAPAAAPPDDLTQIKGIGPRMASMLADNGVATYDDLQHMGTDELRRAVALGGLLPPASLETWPSQAAYAARGDWEGLASYNRR
jgi:predicted flap endonuclease-1-like 5' DNA nuclease